MGSECESKGATGASHCRRPFSACERATRIWFKCQRSSVSAHIHTACSLQSMRHQGLALNLIYSRGRRPVGRTLLPATVEPLRCPSGSNTVSSICSVAAPVIGRSATSTAPGCDRLSKVDTIEGVQDLRLIAALWCSAVHYCMLTRPGSTAYAGPRTSNVVWSRLVDFETRVTSRSLAPP
jgi:hypothetical protein